MRERVLPPMPTEIPPSSIPQRLEASEQMSGNSTVLRVRMSSELKNALKAEAKSKGWTVSKLSRVVLLKHTKLLDKLDRDALIELIAG